MKTKDELIELILENPEEFNQYAEDNKEEGLDLAEVDLSNLLYLKQYSFFLT